MFMILALYYAFIGLMNFLESLLIIYIIMGWFVFFGAIKDREGVLFRVYVFLMSKIEPVLTVIRRYLPSVAGFDFSPLVIFLGLHFAKVLITRLLFILANV